MPPDRMIGAYCFCPVCLFVRLSVCLSVWLSVVNFNLRYNIWTVRDRDFILGMHTPLMMPFQMTPRSMILWFDFDLEAKNSFLDFVATGEGGAYCSVSQSPPWFFIRPSSDGTYDVMVMSVRPGLRLPVFRTFLLHALTYWAEILHMTLF